MARLPINIEKIKVTENLSSRGPVNEKIEVAKYLVILYEKNDNWQKTLICEREDLIKLRDEINSLIENTSTAEILRISNEKAKIIDEYYAKDALCQNCELKLTFNCSTCLFILQSPLERKLFVELSKTKIRFLTQYPLNWIGENISILGKSFENAANNFKEVLTVVDFYIEKRQTKLCVYTDGHTYHERTEEQAQHDRNIDRKLQELGFQVLRYTGKDVNENVGKIISDIQKWVN